MNFKNVNVCNLSTFYQSLLKVWDLFIWQRAEFADSLHWLLEEPLINGARLDVQDSSTPGLTQLLCSTGNTTLRRIIDAAGPRLDNAQAVASLLGLRSVRHTSNILNMWHKRLTEEEQTLLQDYCSGLELPDMDDRFGAVSVNAFISVINPDVSHVCSFCGLTETIFHCFTKCKRLENLFELLENVFNSFNE